MADDDLSSNADSPDVLAALLTPEAKPAPKSTPEQAKQAPPPEKPGTAREEDASPEEPPGDEQFLEEEEAVSEEAEEAPVDPDEVEYELNVDGQPTKAKLKDLKASYSGHIAVEKRIQEAQERRAQAEQVGQALYNTLGEQAQRLQQLDAFLAESQPQIDWNKLRATDPQGYLIAKERQRDIEDRRRGIAQEQQRISQEQQQLNDLAMQTYSQEQAQKLMQKLPELADPEKSKPALERLVSGATQHYGFTRHEIDAVGDHRALVVLNDAIKYRELLARKAQVTGKSGNGQMRGSGSPTGVKTLLRPGNATPSGSEFSARMTAAKEEKAAVERARKSGTVDDVAAMLITRAKRP